MFIRIYGFLWRVYTAKTKGGVAPLSVCHGPRRQRMSLYSPSNMPIAQRWIAAGESEFDADGVDKYGYCNVGEKTKNNVPGGTLFLIIG